jgi:WD40 repeat protein
VTLQHSNRNVVSHSLNNLASVASGAQSANRPVSATRLRLEARAAGLDKVEASGRHAGAASGAAASASRHPPPHSVRFADSGIHGGSAGVASSPGRTLPGVVSGSGTPDRLTKHKGRQSGAFAGYDDFVPDALQEVSSVSDAQVIRCISWSPAPGGPYFALGTTGHALRLCGVDSSSRICVLKSVEELHSGSVYCIAWNSSGSVVATGSNDKQLKIVSIAERDRKITDVGSPVSLAGHTGTVRAATFCETFRSGCLVSGGAGDNIVRVWDVDSQSCVGRLPALSDHVQALVTFPHDPALLLTGW